ncbi:MAG TPA: helix-turn-helix domain-containing protein [Pseudoneobacillus sp.]|nr:helix-turn-helix domain-containing protein [Pseudoneobacillus sp.]
MSKDIYEINSYDQMKVLTHPLRREIFNLLGDFLPRTSQQLSKELKEPRNKVHYHIKELMKVGLLELVEIKKKGNFEEKYYIAVANKIKYNLDVEKSSNNSNSRYELDHSILTQVMDKYLNAVQGYESNKSSLNPMLLGLRKDLNEIELDQLKQDLIKLIDKWFELKNEKENNTTLWEITISLFPSIQ